jgi:hypothetical protein
MTGDGIRLADVEDPNGREADALLDLERAGLVNGGFALPGSRGEDADTGLAFADQRPSSIHALNPRTYIA